MMNNNFNNNGATNNHRGMNGGFIMGTGTITTKEAFMGTVKNAMEAFYGNEYRIEMQEITKNNALRLTGLTILSRESDLAPTIYLDGYYEAYKDGMSMEKICHRIIRVYEENRIREDVDVEQITDFECVKDRICFKLVNREKNAELLKNAPYIEYQDLAVIFFILVSKDSNGAATITVKNPLADMWGVDTDVLYRLAKGNTQRLYKGSVSNMMEVMAEIMSDNADVFFDMNIDEESAFPMYVATNNMKLYGATVLLYDGLLERFAEKIGGDFYVLPSSVHEVLFVPVGESDIGADGLIQMVREVNATQVAPDEVLSDNVYLYHAVEDFLEMM